MKKLLLTAGILSALALTGCDTFLNREEPKTTPESLEPTVQVTPEEGAKPIEKEIPEVPEVVVLEEVELTEETSSENSITEFETIQVTAKQLGLDYKINSYNADMLYENKALTVTGDIDNIFISSTTDKAIIFLKTDNNQSPVMASGAAAFATRAKDLKIKDTVKLLCKGTTAISKAPQVNSCTVL